MDARGGSLRSVWLVVGGLWLLGLTAAGCKDELEGKQAADPLEDPWVASLDTGGEEPSPASAELAAAAPAPASAELPPGTEAAAPSSGPEPTDAAPASDGIADPSPPASGGSKAASSSPKNATPPAQADATAADPVPSSDTAPSSDPEPDTPAAAPTPPPSAAPAAPATPPPLTYADLDGKFRYSGGATGTAARDAALDVTVDALALALRGIARKRLLATNPIEQFVDITVAGDKVTTTYESGVTITCVVDGATCDSKDIEGNRLRARLRWDNGKLVQHMEGKGGARTVVYSLSSDRKRLTVHTKITSDRLPEPMVYKLSYTRK